MYCGTNPIQFCGSFCVVAGEPCGDPSSMVLHGLYNQRNLLQTAKETCLFQGVREKLGSVRGW